MVTHKNWVLKSIGELCEFSSGYGFGPKTWSKRGFPIIRIQNLNGSTQFNYYDGEIDESWIVKPGTLLFAWAGTQGVSFGPTIWKGKVGLLNQHIYKIMPKEVVDSRWLFLALRNITNNIERKAHGFKSTLLHVSKKEITGQVVSLPPLPEQRKIAEILSTWDTTLENLDTLIRAKQEQKKALMQQLLTGKKRLQGFSGKWKFRRFSDFLIESRNPGSDGSCARKITVKLYGKGVFAKDEKRIGSTNTKYYTRSAGQFIYSKLDFLNGAFGIIPIDLDGYESTLDLPAFDVTDKSDVRWLLSYVSRPHFYTTKIGSAAGGRKARRVNPSEFLSMKINAPAKAEQKAIANVLDASDKEIRLLTEQRETIERQKRGLMQRLLTGKVRVKL